MKELLENINRTSERIYYMTRNKGTLSYEELKVIESMIDSMLEDIADAKKEAKHIYDKK